jgi:ADP-ribose pyrophosphatase YjhB (NUDIX family)
LRVRWQRKDSHLRFRLQAVLGRIVAMTGHRTAPPPPSPRFVRRVPDGDTAERYVCDACGHVQYTNPKIVVGSVVTHRNRILLCRRAIEPRKGLWTLPAGYLEENETPEEGARREAREEAQCDIVLDGLLAVYSIPRISQVQLMYRARLDTEQFGAGPESLEVKLFDWDDIPWTEIAFPSAGWALQHHHQLGSAKTFAPFSNPPGQSGNYPQSD